MYEDFISEKLAEAAKRWSAQKNSEAESEYLTAARAWAINHGRQPDGHPPPVAPKVVEFVVVDFGIVASETDATVSAIKAESFLPTYGTDVNAVTVNGEIGGPIPGQTDKFYQTSGSNPKPGTVLKVDGALYVYQRPTPFGGFWLKFP